MDYKETLYKVAKKIDDSLSIIVKELSSDDLNEKERETLTKIANSLCDLAHEVVDGRNIA